MRRSLITQLKIPFESFYAMHQRAVMGITFFGKKTANGAFVWPSKNKQRFYENRNVPFF